MKYPLILLLSIFELAHAQTCIVAVKSKNKITVGAESRVGHPVFNQAGIQVEDYFTDSTCKIISNGSVFFSLSTGLYGDELLQLAKDDLSKYSSLYEFEDNYWIDVRHFIIQKTDSAFQSDDAIGYRNTFSKEFKENYGIAQILVFGVVKDSLVLNCDELFRLPDSLGRLKLTWKGLKGDTFAIGAKEEIYKEKLLSKKKTWEKGVPAGIKYLINYAHNLYPQHVGGPINIITIQRKRTWWVGGKKPPCY